MPRMRSLPPLALQQDRSIDADLYSALTRARRDKDVLAQVSAWHDYRQERFVERGLEGLTGGAAVYHLHDAARYTMSAAQILTGSPLDLVPVSKRPREALNAIAKALGYRHMRAVRGLEDALAEAQVSASSRHQFRRRCQTFQYDFAVRLDAAYIVNDRGQNAPAAREVVTLFADEILGLCEWLELTRERCRAPLLKATINDAIAVLNKPI